jgi:hypothetical protein
MADAYRQLQVARLQLTRSHVASCGEANAGARVGFHPTQRAEYQLPGIEKVVRNNLQSSQFSRMWVFDAENRTVLYSS